MARKLLILSDIKGHFLLETPVVDFARGGRVDEIDQLDSLVLAGLDDENDINKRHEKLVAGGIEVAVRALLEKYPSGVDVVGLKCWGNNSLARSMERLSNKEIDLLLLYTPAVRKKSTELRHPFIFW